MGLGPVTCFNLSNSLFDRLVMGWERRVEVGSCKSEIEQ